MKDVIELIQAIGPILHDNRDGIYLLLAIVYLVLDRKVLKSEKVDENSLQELVSARLKKLLKPEEPKPQGDENGKAL